MLVIVHEVQYASNNIMNYYQLSAEQLRYCNIGTASLFYSIIVFTLNLLKQDKKFY